MRVTMGTRRCSGGSAPRRTRNFAGTVHLIFQPAEEGGGGDLMVKEGLFDPSIVTEFLPSTTVRI